MRSFIHKSENPSNILSPRSNKQDKVKSCERCDEYERMIDNERKSNSQLKKLIEQKENHAKPQTTTTTTTKCTSCSKCDDAKQLLDIEKENSIQLKEQLTQQTKQTQEEKTSKEVSQTFPSIDPSRLFFRQ